MDISHTLEHVFGVVKKIKEGENASYIPELANVDSNIYGISICMCNGKIYSIGDYDTEVAIESVAKVFTLALAVGEHGVEMVQKNIGSQGSFLPFNSVIAAEVSKNHTLNPFVNAGAMATTSMISGNNAWERLYTNMNIFAGRTLTFSNKTYMSEKTTNQRNKALAYLLKSYNRFYGDVDKSVDVYTKQGSLLVSAKDVSVMASVLANNGINPRTKKRVVDKKNVYYILGQMLTGGLYEYSDTWMIDVGIPGKSGVGGVIMAVVPGVMGIGVVSPPLDKNGNSVRGVKTVELLSKILDLTILSGPSQCTVD